MGHGLDNARVWERRQAVLAVLDEGEGPMKSDACVEMEPLPTGDGDVADDTGGDKVQTS